MKRSVLFGCLNGLLIIASIGNYWKTGQIPVLNIFSISSVPRSNTCDDDITCNCKKLHSEINDTYNTAPGFSEIQEIVPLSVLKHNVQFDSLRGLRYLDHSSLSRHYQCHHSTKHEVQNISRWCSERTFLDRKSPLVALVSFHGSGNTWLRYLLEQATGIYTGSIYCDGVLKSIFPGESIVSGNVIAIKTHHADTTTIPKDIQISTGKEKYDKAIILVRNPFDALISEANRRWNSKRSLNSHIGLADETAFISNSKWDWFVEYKGIAWAFLLHTWISQNDTEIHIVQYEKLKMNMEEELNKILTFLNFDVSSTRLKCAIANSEGVFKRSHHLNFSPYSKENHNALKRHTSQALPLLAKYNISY